MGARIKELPPFESLRASYPNDPTPLDIAERVGGRVGENLKNPAMPEYKNTCAIRVSRALNYAGHPVKSHVANARVNSGGDGRWYVYGVRDLNRYLTAIYGPPEVVKTGDVQGSVTAQDLLGEQGIIEFDSYHMDLFDGTTCVHAAYFYAVRTIRLWRAPGKVGEVAAPGGSL
jgi:hypothetical protein